MTTIHLTDAQRDTFAACGLIVIDGVRGLFDGETGKRDTRPNGWRILTEPCDTCQGRARATAWWKQTTGSDQCSNADCVGGRRVVTLTATCPTCEGNGWYQRSKGITRVPTVCGPCDESGVIMLGRFTIPALLPVVRYFAGTPAVRVNTVGPLVYVAADGPTAHGAETIDWHELGEVPRPGQFIARPDRVA